MKRKETLEIEQTLHDMCKKMRIYGCEEVTIGFYNNGHGNEIVDFCTMDSKGILKCYEIKVTLSDLQSDAKLSFYGHYNFLAVTEKLYDKIKDNLDKYIPRYVGVVIPNSDSWSNGMKVVKRARKMAIPVEQEVMLKESMIRSMSYKIQKYRTLDSVEKQREMTRLKKQANAGVKEMERISYILSKFERILRKYYGYELDIEYFISQFEKSKVLLPKNIKLSLTERGKKINKQIKEDMEWEE